MEYCDKDEPLSCDILLEKYSDQKTNEAEQMCLEHFWPQW